MGNTCGEVGGTGHTDIAVLCMREAGETTTALSGARGAFPWLRARRKTHTSTTTTTTTPPWQTQLKIATKDAKVAFLDIINASLDFLKLQARKSPKQFWILVMGGCCSASLFLCCCIIKRCTNREKGYSNLPHSFGDAPGQRGHLETREMALVEDHEKGQPFSKSTSPMA